MTNLDKNREIPKFLLDKRYLLGSVLFVLTFSFMFMAIYSPFSMTAWFSITDPEKIGTTVSFYMVALSIMIISKLLMSQMQSKINFTPYRYIMWVLAEIIIVSLSYTHFTFVFVPSIDESPVNLLLKAFGCILLIIAIPYTILTLYAAYKSKTEELEMLQYKLALNSEPSVMYPSLVNLYDYNGTLKLTINSESLYYMESQDNYVKIYYENQGKLLSYMLRSRTKTIEENLAETSMVRCHRSYMINMDRVKVLRRDKDGVFIEFGIEGVADIPISRTYIENITKWLMK